MILLFLSEAYYDKDKDCYNVWEHLHEVGLTGCKLDMSDVGKVIEEPEKERKKIRAPDCIDGLPGGEDNERDSEPAERLDIIGR